MTEKIGKIRISALNILECKEFNFSPKSIKKMEPSKMTSKLVEELLIKRLIIFSFCSDFIREKNQISATKLSNTKFILITEKISKIQISTAKNRQGREERRVILKVASKSLILYFSLFITSLS